MQILHFESFINADQNRGDLLDSFIQQQGNENDVRTKEAMELFDEYQKFCADTKSGKHGKTAQFWFNYICMIQEYHTFTKSIRSGDLEMFVAILPAINNYYFSLNHPNYARWLVKYHENLLPLLETHLDVYKDFKRSYFGVQRTKKPFSCIPVDLTLEQTINANALSRQMGIGYFTESIAARQKWAVSFFENFNYFKYIFEVWSNKKWGYYKRSAELQKKGWQRSNQ